MFGCHIKSISTQSAALQIKASTKRLILYNMHVMFYFFKYSLEIAFLIASTDEIGRDSFHSINHVLFMFFDIFFHFCVRNLHTLIISMDFSEPFFFHGWMMIQQRTSEIIGYTSLKTLWTLSYLHESNVHIMKHKWTKSVPRKAAEILIFLDDGLKTVCFLRSD